MKILHVVPTYLPATRYGGPIYSVHALCAALTRQGHDVHVYTTNVDGSGVSPVPLGTPVNRDGVHVTYFPTAAGRRLYRSPAMAKALSSAISTFDVVHLHSVFLWPTMKASRFARRARVPYVISPRGMLVKSLIETKSRLLKEAWIRLVELNNLQHASLLHFTSEIERRSYNELSLPARPNVVIPNGLDLPRPQARSGGVSEPDKMHRVLFLGRVNWKKGLDRLIKAASLVPDTRFLIAGNDEENYRAKLKLISDEAGVADRIEFLGPVTGEAKWDLIASADLFVLPSYSENFGNAVLEAMACGVPVVVTPEVGLAPAVLEADAGLVCDGRPEVLGKAINDLLADPPLRARMGEHGRTLVATQYCWDAIATQMSTAYEAMRRNSASGRHP